MKFKLFLLLLLPALALTAQTDPAPKKRTYEMPDGSLFAETIKAEDLKALLYVLASDSLQGRETGEEGQRKAARFIARMFKEAGIPAKGDRNDYQQGVQLQNDTWTDLGLKVGDQEFKNRTDFYVFPANNPDKPEILLKEVVFVGYGIEDEKYSDYTGTDVSGKAVVFYFGEPMSKEGNSLLTGTNSRSQWSLDWKKKIQTAKKKGATAAFVIMPQFEDGLRLNRKSASTFGWKPGFGDPEKATKDLVPFMFVNAAVGKAILGDKAAKVEQELADLANGGKFKPVKVKSKIQMRLDKETKRLEGSNVFAVIEGSDEKLKKEYVLVTAHYDHLGMADSTVIYYGADDNGSGSSGVIEIARAFAEAKKQGKGPKRTVICMLVSGEEKGLLGSKYYTDVPLYPLDKTVVDVNIDMIGRVDERHADNPNYVYSIGSGRISTHLKDVCEMVNAERTKLELDYQYDRPDDPNRYYERSDHYNFAEKGIPVVFFFNGTHPDYHRPTDTADKINFDALAKRAQLAFYVAWEAANRPTGFPADVEQPKKRERD
jgi:hypothetical protein